MENALCLGAELGHIRHGQEKRYVSSLNISGTFPLRVGTYRAAYGDADHVEDR